MSPVGAQYFTARSKDVSRGSAVKYRFWTTPAQTISRTNYQEARLFEALQVLDVDPLGLVPRSSIKADIAVTEYSGYLFNLNLIRWRGEIKLERINFLAHEQAASPSKT